MRSKPDIEICIQAEPNLLGIDHARIVLNSAVRQRLIGLAELAQDQGLISVQFEDVPVHWYRAGVLQTARHFTTCELLGRLDHHDLNLNLEAWFYGEDDGSGEFNNGAMVRGHWFWGVTAELETGRLVERANDEFEIHEWSDYDLFTSSSNTTRLVRGVREVHIARAKTTSCNANHGRWPDPFTRWANPQSEWPDLQVDGSKAHVRLPHDYVPTPRGAVAELALELLLGLGLRRDLDPNQRCALYTLAASLLICPDDVKLSVGLDGIPSFLKPEAFRDADEMPLTEADLVPAEERFCGTCASKLRLPTKTIHIRYQDLAGHLQIRGSASSSDWSATWQGDNLALLYEDHVNNEFAWQILETFLPKYHDDHARLKILAFGLDALKRLLDSEGCPWHEDLRAWLETPGSSFGKNENRTMMNTNQIIIKGDK